MTMVDSEVEGLLHGLEEEPRKGRPPKPSAVSRMPLETKQAVENLAKELGITNADAISILMPRTKSVSALQKVRELEALGGRPSGAGFNSAEWKDTAMSLFWQKIAQDQMKSMNRDDEDSGGMNLEKIVGITLLMQANMQQTMAINAMNKQQNDGNGGKGNEMIQMMLAQNQTLMNNLIQALGLQRTQEQVAGQVETAIEETKDSFGEAIKVLQAEIKKRDDEIAVILKKVDENKDKPKDAMSQLKDAFAQVESLENFVMQIAQKKGLTQQQTQDLTKVGQTLDINIKYALAQRALAIMDQIGVPIAKATGEKVAEHMFRGGSNVPTPTPTQ